MPSTIYSLPLILTTLLSLQAMSSISFQSIRSSLTNLLPASSQISRKGVKIVKFLFKEALKDSKDPWLAPLVQRNTPIESSPAQRLISRRTRALLLTASNLLYPKIPENVSAKLKLKRRKAKWNHECTLLHPSRITIWARGRSDTSSQESRLENGYLY